MLKLEKRLVSLIYCRQFNGFTRLDERRETNIKFYMNRNSIKKSMIKKKLYKLPQTNS